MRKRKNYNVVNLCVVVFLSLIFASSCSTSNLAVTKVEGKQIPITDSYDQEKKITTFIRPYKEHIDKNLSEVLAVAPETIDKSGVLQSPMGNLFSQVVYNLGNPIFMQRENKAIDFVFLNHGGIRSIIPKGNVTAGTAYEIMPFENNLVVVALKGEQVEELLTYFINEKKPHPLYGLSFTLSGGKNYSNVLIQGKPFQRESTYYVGTNDYLANGGDNMIFFKKATQRFELDYKLRNILIDYFQQVDIIPIINDQRITVE